MLCEVSLLIFIKSVQKYFDLLVGQIGYLEPNQTLPQLINGHSRGFILIYEIEALLNSYVVLPKILTDFSEYASLPLDSELLL